MEERITNKDFYPELEFCINCKYYGEPNGCNRVEGSCDNYAVFVESYNKLQELEDGFEDGTIVKPSCRVGDVLYRVDIGGNVVQGEVGMLQCLKDGRWKFRFIYKLRSYSSKSSYDEYCDKIGKTYFRTYEEVEKKLAELKGEE